MKQSAVVLVFLVVSAAPLRAQQAPIVITRSEAQTSREGPAENSTGSVRVDQRSNSTGRASTGWRRSPMSSTAPPSARGLPPWRTRRPPASRRRPSA
jgi:hypothetical protein